MKPSRCNNETKWRAREEAIFKPAREYGLTGDYVTLCNVQDDSDWYEYKQAKHIGRFVGVDNQRCVINDNKRLPGMWIHGDLYSVLVKHEPWINPAIIHFDTISMGDRAIPEARKIMRFFEHYSNLLFVVNVVSKHPYNGKEESVDALINKLYDSNWFYENSNKWQLKNLIEYESGKTRMTTFSFYKE